MLFQHPLSKTFCDRWPLGLWAMGGSVHDVVATNAAACSGTVPGLQRPQPTLTLTGCTVEC